MKLSDLQEVQRLASRRQKIENDLVLARAGDLMLVQLDGREPQNLKLSLMVPKAGIEASDDEILFDAIIEVVVMSFEQRRKVIDRRLLELGVEP